MMKGASRSRGGFGRLGRAFSVLRNYGFSSHRFEESLDSFRRFLQDNNCPATFACPSVLLEKSEDLVGFLKGFDVAIHGMVHIDYRNVTAGRIKSDLRQAILDFESAGLNPSGFRAPYLRWNTDLLKALRSAGLTYDSSSSVLWNASTGRGSLRNQVADLLRYYGSRLEGDYASIPRIAEGTVQLPVSLPDDEILVERLRISRSDRMVRFWSSMLRDSYERRRLLVMQVHPERFEICEGALDRLLKDVKERNVWVTSLSEVSSWWLRRCAAEVQVDGDRRLEYDDKLGFVIEAGEEVFQPGDLVPTESLVRISPRHRLHSKALEIGLVPSTGSSEGYRVDDSVRNENNLIKIAEEKNLLRKSLWPDGHRSAFCLSGDIDALTAMDFVRRPLSDRNRS